MPYESAAIIAEKCSGKTLWIQKNSLSVILSSLSRPRNSSRTFLEPDFMLKWILQKLGILTFSKTQHIICVEKSSFFKDLLQNNFKNKLGGSSEVPKKIKKDLLISWPCWCFPGPDSTPKNNSNKENSNLGQIWLVLFSICGHLSISVMWDYPFYSSLKNTRKLLHQLLWNNL